VRGEQLLSHLMALSAHEAPTLWGQLSMTRALNKQFGLDASVAVAVQQGLVVLDHAQVGEYARGPGGGACSTCMCAWLANVEGCIHSTR